MNGTVERPAGESEGYEAALLGGLVCDGVWPNLN